MRLPLLLRLRPDREGRTPPLPCAAAAFRHQDTAVTVCCRGQVKALAGLDRVRLLISGGGEHGREHTPP